MPRQSERLERAARYVAGVMGDAEREAAERDMATDDAFREAVVAVAERMHLFDLPTDASDAGSEQRWRAVASRIAEMPHLPAFGPPTPEPAHGHRPRIAGRTTPVGRGLSDTGDRRTTAIAIGLTIAFALGFLAGRLF